MHVTTLKPQHPLFELFHSCPALSVTSDWGCNWRHVRRAEGLRIGHWAKEARIIFLFLLVVCDSVHIYFQLNCLKWLLEGWFIRIIIAYIFAFLSKAIQLCGWFWVLGSLPVFQICISEIAASTLIQWGTMKRCFQYSIENKNISNICFQKQWSLDSLDNLQISLSRKSFKVFPKKKK